MTKLTNEELRKLLRQYAAVSYAYMVAERDSDDESKAEAKSDELEAEILQRMAEGAAGEASPQGDLPNKAISFLREAVAQCRTGKTITFNADQLTTLLDALSSADVSGSASTAGPRPKCPKCGKGDNDSELFANENGTIFADCKDCHTKINIDFWADFAQFFAPAPAEDVKEKN